MACLHQMTARELDGMFPDDNACKAYLASRRWPDKVRCPRCGNPKVYRLRGFRWQCQACNSKGYQFSVLVGTIFENTKIPLKDWFRTIHLMLTKRGLTIVEVLLVGEAHRRIVKIAKPTVEISDKVRLNLEKFVWSSREK